MKPSLYVVSINYNTAEHTIEMVHNLRQSHYDNLHILIVDNCSQQEDYEKLQQANLPAQLIRSEQNLGFSGGNNIGLRIAAENKADYVMLLNNDTTVEPDALCLMVDCLEQGKAHAVCPKILNYHNRRLIGYAGGSLSDFKGAVSIPGAGQQDNGQFDRSRPITFASGCCVMMKTETWKQLDYMEEKYFLYFEDTALSAKLRRLNKTTLYLPQAIIYHKESVSTTRYSDNYQYYFCRNRLLYIRENIPFPTKLISFCYTALYMLKHLIKGNFSLNNIMSAIKDFSHSRFGQRQTH